jgi:hypothetical protein
MSNPSETTLKNQCHRPTATYFEPISTDSNLQVLSTAGYQVSTRVPNSYGTETYGRKTEQACQVMDGHEGESAKTAIDSTHNLMHLACQPLICKPTLNTFNIAPCLLAEDHHRKRKHFFKTD